MPPPSPRAAQEPAPTVDPPGSAEHPLRHFKDEISTVRRHVLEHAALDVLALHGPTHWRRVELHALALSAALKVSPLVPVLFSVVHDSQRTTDGSDPWHGERAALFVRKNRQGLFAFLSDAECGQLEQACEKHSAGQLSTDPVIQACWDADRLDLGRVGRIPDPRYLSSAFARRPEVIKLAVSMTPMARMSLPARSRSPGPA